MNSQQNESLGFLIVEVKTANGALPVENALVYIYPMLDESENGRFPTDASGVLYSLRTDISGKTEKVALNTKPRSLSMSPSNETPYVSYNVYIVADGFFDTYKMNVPIFQGITSIQTAEMIPLSEYADPDSQTPDSIGRFSVSEEPDL
ncbi:MAG: hypothetical protein J6B60_01355 [Clostridia bacterium]|nr:hypothetical protein [Clostridia bacterium]